MSQRLPNPPADLRPSPWNLFHRPRSWFDMFAQMPCLGLLAAMGRYAIFDQPMTPAERQARSRHLWRVRLASDPEHFAREIEGELDRKAIRAKPKKLLPDDSRWKKLNEIVPQVVPSGVKEVALTSI
jgi:hypothetical protein